MLHPQHNLLTYIIERIVEYAFRSVTSLISYNVMLFIINEFAFIREYQILAVFQRLGFTYIDRINSEFLDMLFSRVEIELVTDFICFCTICCYDTI